MSWQRYIAYKNSGMEWLGEIPAEWEISTFRRLVTRIEQGWSPVAEERAADEGEWAVIKLGAVSRGQFRSDQHKAMIPDVSPNPSLEVKNGDFLMGIVSF